MSLTLCCLTHLLRRSYQHVNSNLFNIVRSSSNRCDGGVALACDRFVGSSPGAPLVILHGLLGSRNNWKSMAKSLAKATSRTIYTLDARNHGESPHTSDMDYTLMGNDLLMFLSSEGVKRATVMGHSMGGRAAMAAALSAPKLISQLVVLDISPFGVSTSISTLPLFVEMMLGVQVPPDLPLHKARKMVDYMLQPIVPEASLRQFLLTNLYKCEQSGQFKWRANLETIGRTFNSHMVTFPLAKAGKTFDGPTAFIAGANSDYIKAADHTAIRGLFPTATFHSVAEAGHWLHADKPKEFLELVTPILTRC